MVLQGRGLHPHTFWPIMIFESEYWLVFISGLVSSTLLPGNSEIVFISTLSLDAGDPMLLLLFVTTGNTLGGVISWLMGRTLAIRYPADELTNPSYRQAVKRIQQWGSPSLLLSWVPVLGDPLCLAAGWLKISMLASLVYIFTGKLVRYYLLLHIII